MSLELVVDKKHLEDCLDYIDLVNSVPLENIVWVGQIGSHEIDPKLIEQWKFTGLSNIWFFKDELRTK